MRNAPLNLFIKQLHSAYRHLVMSPTSLPEPPTSYKKAKQETKQRSYTMLQVLAYTISYTMFPFDHIMHKKNEVGIHQEGAVTNKEASSHREKAAIAHKIAAHIHSS